MNTSLFGMLCRYGEVFATATATAQQEQEEGGGEKEVTAYYALLELTVTWRGPSQVRA